MQMQLEKAARSIMRRTVLKGENDAGSNLKTNLHANVVEDRIER